MVFLQVSNNGYRIGEDKKIRKPALQANLRTSKHLGATGLEPAASWSQTMHSTKLSYAPRVIILS